MVNKIWGCFIVIGVLSCLLTGKADVVNQEILNSCKTTFDMVVQLFPIMALWLGLMNIAKVSGLLDKIARKLSPLLRFIFPEIPRNHESFSLIASNVIANMFGLGNAATPFGLKAMKSLQELNPKKDTASRSMITFLVINTSGITLIPTTIISLRMLYESNHPTEIVFACLLSSFIATISGLAIDRFLATRKRAFHV